MVAAYHLSPTTISQYFLLDCNRFLRWSLPGKLRAEQEQIPSPPFRRSPFLDALFAGGHQWEAEVLKQVKQSACVKQVASPELDSDSSNESDGKLSYRETLQILDSLQTGEWVYQACLQVPASFYAAYGLDPDQILLSWCYPDLIYRAANGKLQIIDVKASESLKITHRIQTAYYALVLDHMLRAEGIAQEVDLEHAGIWLRETPATSYFELRGMIPHLEQFLRRQLPQILKQSAEQATWHVYFNCDACQWLDICRAQAIQNQDISQLPYLSPENKQYLSGQRVGAQSLADLYHKLHIANEGERLLADSAHLRAQGETLKRQSQALIENQILLHPAASLALPKQEQIALFLSLESEPTTRKVCSIGLLIKCPGELRPLLGLDEGFKPAYFLAQTAEQSEPIQADFIRYLHRFLSRLDQYNQTLEWEAQLSLQSYVFEAYERKLLTQLLLNFLNSDLHTEATELLFYFHSIDNIQATEHLNHQDAKQWLAYPLVVLLESLRRLVALPVPFVWRLQDVLAVLPEQEHSLNFQTSVFHHLTLSNYLDVNLIHRLWKGESEQIKRLGASVRQRLYGLSEVLYRLREMPEIKPNLILWPPKFKLLSASEFTEPVLSRLAFMMLNENLSRGVASRESRSWPARQRELQESVLTLRYQQDDWWQLETPTMLLKRDPFFNHLLWPDCPEGEYAQLQYDDLKQYHKWSFQGIWLNAFQQEWLHIVSIEELRHDPLSGLITELRITSLKRNKNARAARELRSGDRYYLGPRYSNPNSAKIFKALQNLNQSDPAHFVALLKDVCRANQALPFSKSIQRFMSKLVPTWGLTTSQQAAFEAASHQQLTLVWGPPGTGKTHFLASAIVGWFEAHLNAGESCRIIVAAFTHAAIDNVLLKVQSRLRDRGLPYQATKALRSLGDHPPESPIAAVDYDHVAKHYSENELLILGMTSWNCERLIKDNAEAPQLLILDEASQMTVPEAAQFWQWMSPQTRVLVVGDHYQLAPIIEGDYPEPEGKDPLLVRSIFEAFQYSEALQSPKNPTFRQVVYPLLECWRMCDVLTEFVANQVYTMKLETAAGPLAYHCASDAIAKQRLNIALSPAVAPELNWLLDPAYPLVVCVLEGLQALRANLPEAQFVAQISLALRQHLKQTNGLDFANSLDGDRAFWRDGLFIVSPHHAQIQLIRRELNQVYEWQSEPFVDTVDKMQGQEAQAVIVSYGVSDLEAALQEKEFIYDRNRLNVSITRARSKCIVCLPQPLLQGHPSILENDRVAQGFGLMQGLLDYAQSGQELLIDLSEGIRWRCYRKGIS